MAKWDEDSWWKTGLTAMLLGAAGSRMRGRRGSSVSLTDNIKASGAVPVGLARIAGKHNLGDLQLFRKTDIGELKRLVEDKYLESPSIMVANKRLSSWVMHDTGYSMSPNGAPATIRFKRGGFDFDVRPGNLDIVTPWDSGSPTTGTIVKELQAGKTYEDILRQWADAQIGVVGGLKGIAFGPAGPRVKSIREIEAEYNAFVADRAQKGIKVIPPEYIDPLVATGNFIPESEPWSRLRYRTDQWAELKPLRKVPASAIDFVEVPRYMFKDGARTEMMPRGERFALQRKLEALGIKYRVYDKGLPHAGDDFHPSMEATLMPGGYLDRPVPGVTLPKIRPSSFHEDAKGGKSPDRFALSRNFLATDETPDTLFGIPVVADRSQYTPEDLAFFRKHPEAGGYYDMGDGEEQPPEEPVEERPVQAASKGGHKANPDLFHEDAKGGRTVHAAMDAGKPKKKIPPIVKGPIHYGPPPAPSRGKYPGVSNNPGNVEKHERRSDKTLFKGEIGDGVRPKRFANFSDPVDGLAAAAAVLSRRAAGLAAKGLPFTIENYVPGYAPKSENDTEGYIRNLSRYSGFARDEELDPGNVDDMARLLKNVVRFESGVPNSEWFTDDEYRRAARAMNRSPESAPSLPASINRQASGGSTQTSEEARHG